MSPPAGALMQLVAYGHQDVHLNSDPNGPARPFVECAFYSSNVREDFGMRSFHNNSGHLLNRSELVRVFEYSRFGKWKETNEHLFGCVVVKVHVIKKGRWRPSRCFCMSAKYKYYKIVENKGEICAALRAERMHPRNSVKWEGWGF